MENLLGKVPNYLSTAAGREGVVDLFFSKIRSGADCPGFGFHDCRHHFISYAVMSGIDYLTIARWVGHKDGGILIGRVYGHLTDVHARKQAQRLQFNV